MMTNKYKGICGGCGKTVLAGEGVYASGSVWCDEPTIEASLFSCPTDHKREAIQRVKGYDRSRGQNDRTFVSEFPDVNEWLAGYWAKVDARNADPEYQAKKKTASERRERQDAEWAKRGLKRCSRCAGEGSADQWKFTGSTCFQCEGRGAVPA